MFAKARIKHAHLILLIGCLLITSYPKAQNWPKTYGDNFHSLIKDLSESYDKGYYLTAFTYDYQGIPEYGWIIKTDINGNTLWDKKYGDGNYMNWFSSSFKTRDDGLIISGITSKYSSGDNDPLFIKTNVCCEIEWCKVLICPDQNYGSDVIQIEDGSYIGLLAYYGEGDTYARISLVKMDQTGEPVWIQRLAQEDTLIYNEEGYHLLETYDSNYIISGRVYYPGMKPFWIMTDTTGEQIWDLKWSGIVGICFQTIENQPGKFYSIGYKIPPGHNNLPAIYKFDEDGNQIDELLILGDTIHQGGGGALTSVDDSTLLTGLVWSSQSNPDVFNSEVIKIDTLGNILNRRVLLLEDQAPKSMILDSDHKILIAGNYVINSTWDIYLWKTNSNLEDDTLYSQPITYDSLCPYDIQSDTVNIECGIFVNIDELPTKEEYESAIKISPNPSHDWITLTLPDVAAKGAVEMVVYDIYGREAGKLGSGVVIPDNRMILMDISAFSPGMYIAVIIDKKGRRYTGKFVVN